MIDILIVKPRTKSYHNRSYTTKLTQYISPKISMKISPLTPETEVLSELATRLARLRKAQGYSQIELAKEAGIGVATLRRIEAGRDSQLGSWLKLLKTLNMMHSIDSLLPENYNSPMAEVSAVRGRKQRQSASTSGVVWGDEVKAEN